MPSRFLLFVSIICVHFGLFAQRVSEFTGDFNYAVPLLSVPSPDGSSIPVSIGYSSGVKVQQRSSEVGLGWDLFAGGAIVRSISGLPDDYLGIQPNPTSGVFSNFVGILRMKDNQPGSTDVYDFYNSTYKLDTTVFTSADYDEYSVLGSSMNGKLNLNLFDYASVPEISWSPYSLFTKKGQFSFEGDFAGTQVSRHYPTSPINSNSPAYFPGASVTYNNNTSTADYAGGSSEGYLPSNNRLITPNFVEYFTNQEISNGVTGFVDYKATNHNRSSSDFVMDGIGGFRITNGSGIVYHYSLPVYVNSIQTGNFPLNNDYSAQMYDVANDNYIPNLVKTTNTQAGNGYLLKDPDNNDGANDRVIEYKQEMKYAYMWLLTAITGPDYIDYNNNGKADLGDKGYWVSFDYFCWNNSFEQRIPEYGYNLSFQGGEGDLGWNYLIDSVDETSKSHLKISGRFGTYTRINKQVYHLSTIQTSSHTGLFVYDYRLDDHSSPSNYDNEFHGYRRTGFSVNNNSASWVGTLWDRGGPDEGYCLQTNTYTSEIDLYDASADGIQITISEIDIGPGDGINLDYTRYGNNTTAGTITTISGNTKVVSMTGSAGCMDGTRERAGYKLDWKPLWDNVQPSTDASIRVEKVLLFNNDDFGLLPAKSSSNWVPPISGNYTSTDLYNVGWYNSNQSSIENTLLSSVEFGYDYSLAKKYYLNYNTVVSPTTKDNSPTEVFGNVSVSQSVLAASGKLTLKEVKVFGQRHVKLTPSILFEYSSNNPDYDPRKEDVWGYYKSDSNNGLSVYQNETSAQLMDAWSLKKVTSPMGGSFSIEYEPDSYSSVLEGEVIRGARRTYPINAANGGPYIWNVTLEGANTIADYQSLVSSPPSGTTVIGCIPWTQTVQGVADSDGYRTDGTVTFSNTGGTIQMPTAYNLTSSMDHFTLFSASGSSNPTYTGNGFVSFLLPKGHEVKGGGIRVKKISYSNGISESYSTVYNYENGVATCEADRFDHPERTRYKGNLYEYKMLRSYDFDKHKMKPAIGYSKVTVKNIGLTNPASSEGALVLSFLTSDENQDNYSANVEKRWQASSGTYCTSAENDTTLIVEVLDKFSGMWGALIKTELYDSKDNLVSVSSKEYSHLSNGVISELFHSTSSRNKVISQQGGQTYTCPVITNTISILRRYPYSLVLSEEHSMGGSTITESLKFHKVLGTPILVRHTAPNKSTSVIRNYPAYENSNYSSMGPKSLNSSNMNQLGLATGLKVVADSTITNNSDFTSFQVSTFKRSFALRNYNRTLGKFENVSQSNHPIYLPDRQYSWNGNVNSYGLFSGTELSSAPFDFSLASVDPKWKLLSETTLFDPEGHLLEVLNNNSYSSSRYGYDGRFEISSASNSTHGAFTFSGFEDTLRVDPLNNVIYYDGELHLGSSTWSTGTSLIKPHSGKYLASFTSGSNPVVFRAEYSVVNGKETKLLSGRKYKAFVWVHKDSDGSSSLSISKNGTLVTSINKSNSNNLLIGDWYKLELEFDAMTLSNGDVLEVLLSPGSSSSYFDDFLFRSVDSNVSSKVIDKLTGELSAEIDSDALATFYSYDEIGRNTKVFQEVPGIGIKLLKKNKFNYSRSLN